MQLNLWEKYGKSLVAAVYAVAIVAIPLWTGDRHIDPSEGIVIATAVGNAVLVWVVPLRPTFKSIKSVVNAIMAGLAVAQTQIAGGIDANDTMMIAAAVLAVLGVTVAPAASLGGQQPVRVGTGADS